MPANRLITLNNGVQMPVLGFGVFQVPDEKTALDTGATVFFDHRDPEMVTWLGGRRVD